MREHHFTSLYLDVIDLYTSKSEFVNITRVEIVLCWTFMKIGILTANVKYWTKRHWA